MKKRGLRLLLLATSVFIFSGCGTVQKKQAGTASSGSVKTIQVGYVENSYPLDYEDEKGNLTGYEIEVLKLIDEKLPDYQFEYSSGAQDALFAGLGTGKYDLVVTNSFYTKERAENYILPKNPLGASLVGMVLPKSETDIKSFSDAAKAGLKLAPILAGDGLYYVIDQYNQENQSNQIKLEATDSGDSFMSSISWVAEGRYDFAIWPKNYWEKIVAAKDGSLHQYANQVQFIECKSVHTYPVIAKGEDAFAAEVDTALGEIYQSGEMQELSKKFYGYDAFAYDSDN
ncbi:MAG: transporter substrate-binding domain-containing protein [Butyrivibrio sp.]|nr:transporter substrate-binding domain-containing protein [Butyrivibrio sp.]